MTEIVFMLYDTENCCHMGISDLGSEGTVQGSHCCITTRKGIATPAEAAKKSHT